MGTGLVNGRAVVSRESPSERPVRRASTRSALTLACLPWLGPMPTVAYRLSSSAWS